MTELYSTVINSWITFWLLVVLILGVFVYRETSEKRSKSSKSTKKAH